MEWIFRRLLMLTSDRRHRGHGYVSIQIVPEGTGEARVLKYLRRRPQNYPRSQNVMKLLDYLTIDGSNRSYEGLVLEVMSQNTFRLMQDSSHGKLPLNKFRVASRQVAMGLEYLHKCGIDHEGLIPGSYRSLFAHYE